MEDLQETRRKLKIIAERSTDTGWLKLWFEALGQSRESIVVDAPEPWTVLQGKRIAPQTLRLTLRPDHVMENGVELTTDDDDSFHAGRAITLAAHSADVESFAQDYAMSLGLTKSVAKDLALAAWLHDIGKADRRFQVLLRGGSEIDFFKDEMLWAKSAMPAGAKSAHRLAQKKSKYPKGARHEVQSVAMIEKHMDVVKAKAHDMALVLHLVASHHGYCRPFAPVVIDDIPVEVVLPNHLSKNFGGICFRPTSSNHELHRLDSPLADRFWGLVEKYGWQELFWLEALLRLADHRASEKEQNA